jgi:hypothetical protein
MSIANPLWGAPRIHGELLKLGVYIGQTSVAKYMVRRRDPPSQGWRTFLRNHADGIAAMDMFVVPTISFRLLYGLLIMGHGPGRGEESDDPDVIAVNALLFFWLISIANRQIDAEEDADFCILDSYWLLVIVGIFSAGMLVIDTFMIWPLMKQWF